MARDDDKLLFSSEWETDQILQEGEITISATGSSAVEETVATFSLAERPFMDFDFKVSGQDYWWKPGGLATPISADFKSIAGYWKTTTTSAVVGLVNGDSTTRDVTVRWRVYTATRSA